MEAIIIILLVTILGFSAMNWWEARTQSRLFAEKAKKEAVAQEPLNMDSVKSVLQSNGYTPEPPSTDLDEREAVRFKIGDTFFRIDTSRLPYLTLDLGYGLDKDDDIDLMYKAAWEVMAGIYVGKINILRGEDASAVIFEADIIASNYTWFRDNFKQYLDIVIETRKRFYDVYGRLKEEKKEQMGQVDRLMTQPRPGSESKKVLS